MVTPLRDEATIASGMPSDEGAPLALGGYRVHSLAREVLARQVLGACEGGARLQVFFANTNFVVQCRALRPRLLTPSVLVVNDGIGMDLAALLVHRRRFAENLNGTDFVPYLCARSPRPLRFFLLGSAPGVAERAGRHLAESLGQEIVGSCDGYREFAAAGEGLVARINALRPDIVLVAFGNPRQEAWILDHRETLTAPVLFGVGALLDFLSGNVERAPGWVRRWRMEWIYRLAREPRRLARRYTLDLIAFFAVCLRQGRRLAGS